MNTSIKRQATLGPQAERFSGKIAPRSKKGPMDWGASKIPHYPDPRQEVLHG